MMNQLIFDGMASYDDWGIYLTSLSIGDPEPKENYISIPNRDGDLDLSEALTGEIHYSNRTLEAVFTIKPSDISWAELLRDLRAYLNGKKRVIRLENEPGYFFKGRCKTQFERDGVLGKFSVSANCDPWKYKENLTYYNFTIGSTGEVTGNCINSRKRVIPTITASAEVTVLFNGMSISVNAGTHRLTSIVFTEGDNEITITGVSGTTVKFEYQEGAL